MFAYESFPFYSIGSVNPLPVEAENSRRARLPSQKKNQEIDRSSLSGSKHTSILPEDCSFTQEYALIAKVGVAKA